MIDTITSKHKIELDSNQLGYPWLYRIRQLPDGNCRVHYDRVEIYKGTNISTHYHPADYLDPPLLVTEISSVPRLIYGNNFTPIHSVEEIIPVLNNFFGYILPGVDIDAGEGVLGRVDFFKDYQVGDNVLNYLEGISRLFYSRRSRIIYTNQPFRQHRCKCNGVEFRSQYKRLYFYDKCFECGDPRAYGLLRQESSFKRTEEIAEAMGIFEPRLRDITPEIAYSILQRDLTKIGLDRTIIVGDSIAERMLCDYFGTRRGRFYHDFLKEIEASQTLDPQRLAAMRGVTCHTINRYFREIINAGIAPTLITSEERLPGLVANMPSSMLGQNCPKVSSDTVISNIHCFLCGVFELTEVIK